VLSGADRDRLARRCTKLDQDALPPIYENDEISCRKVLEMSDSKMEPKVVEANHTA
jgi:hypothetical protein